MGISLTVLVYLIIEILLVLYLFFVHLYRPRSYLKKLDGLDVKAFSKGCRSATMEASIVVVAAT